MTASLAASAAKTSFGPNFDGLTRKYPSLVSHSSSTHAAGLLSRALNPTTNCPRNSHQVTSPVTINTNSFFRRPIRSNTRLPLLMVDNFTYRTPFLKSFSTTDGSLRQNIRSRIKPRQASMKYRLSCIGSAFGKSEGGSQVGIWWSRWRVWIPGELWQAVKITHCNMDATDASRSRQPAKISRRPSPVGQCGTQYPQI